MRMRIGGLAVVFLAVAAAAQKPGMETAKDMFAKLTAEEQQQYQAATKEFQASHYSEALPVYKTLLAAHAGDSFLAKMVAESAVNTGDLKLAKDVMEPVAKADEDDWQAIGLVLRVAAQSGDKAGRDAGFEHMLDLYKRDLTPKGLTQYIVESVKAGDKQVLIFNSFVPWGNFKVYNYARVFDKDGKLLFRITLESSDFDQPLWAKTHAKEAAAGGRMFSLDGYSEGAPTANGQRTETHSTYGFIDGQPTYDEVKARFIAIAGGKGGAMSSNNHPVQ